MRRSHSGITLLELTVVLGIVGIVIAMLFPAIQRVRESARRTTCQNNLKQSALAIQAFHGTHRHLPSLYNGTFIKHPTTQWDEYHFHSWQTAILPHIEQSAIFEQLDFSEPATSPANQPNVNIELPVFICPSTSNYTPVVPNITQRQPIVPVGTAARSDYEAIGGILREPKTGGYGNHSYDFIDVGVWGKPRYKPIDDVKFDGLYRTRFRDVTDGLTNTMMIGEMSGRPDIYERGKPDRPVDSNGPVGQPAWAISGIFWAIAIGEHHGVNYTNQQGLYSFHDVGVHVGLADGSVRLLSNSTDLEILHGLATRAGGESFTLD